MKLISWNVNGLRAALKKNFLEYLENEDPDILAIQETKLQESQIPEQIKELENCNIYWSFAERKGYSGVALFSKQKPKNVSYSIGEERFDREGRVIIAEFDDFSLINCYFPNGQMNDERLKYKLDFYDKMFEKMEEIKKSGKDLIVCGDYNTAHKPIDLANPKVNEKYSGFLPIERARLDKLIQNNWIDTFRHFDQRPEQYSWWTYRFGARKRNIGWRIDYFFVNIEFLPNVKNVFIQQEILGSDHCPVGIEIEINKF